MFRRLLLRQNGFGRLRPRDLRLQPRGLVRRRGPLTRGALPRRRPRNPSAAANFVAVADIAPAAACADAATGPADLGSAVRLTSPAAYRALPARPMAGGRPAEPMDARIYDDVLWSCGGTAFASPRRARLATTLMAMARGGSRQRSVSPREAGTCRRAVWRPISDGYRAVAAPAPAPPARSSPRSSGSASGAGRGCPSAMPLRHARR